MPYGGSAGQVVTVVAPSPGSTTATLTAWRRTSTGWAVALGPWPAHVGSDGVGQASESSSRTPAGVWGLTRTFGYLGNPGTRLSYFRTDPLDWWDENPASPTYNQHVRRSTSPGGASEHLYYIRPQYAQAIVMDYNTAGVPGAGSAFFIHVSDGGATAGCVSIAQSSLVSLMRWLDPSLHPVVDVGVG